MLNEIESVTGRRWGLPKIPEVMQKLAADGDRQPLNVSWYEFLVYLRHHGFPSPLLDWTRSAYIAAYFAMEQSSNAQCCSVVAFVGMLDKMQTEADILINPMGPYITTDNRHFAQKASYTIATQWDKEAKVHRLCSHYDVTRPVDGIFDFFIKITIPRCDRILAFGTGRLQHKSLYPFPIGRLTRPFTRLACLCA